jgi:cytochrome c-type biogenesis protein CcmH/NrfG
VAEGKKVPEDFAALALEQSLDLARRALEMRPEDAETRLVLGKILEKKGSYLEAVDQFNEAIRLQAD